MRLEIPKWDELQHFKNRQPIWIRLYRKLRHKRGWRVASHGASKLLVDLWLLASEGDELGVVDMAWPELAWEVRESEADVQQWVQELAALELITLISPRYQAVDLEKRRDREETEAFANANEGEPSFGEVMAVVRTELSPNDPDETKRSGNVLRRDFAGKVSALDVIDACRGARKLVEAGLVDEKPPGSTIGLRFLRSWKHGSRYLWDAAIETERLGIGASNERGRSALGRLEIDLAG